MEERRAVLPGHLDLPALGAVDQAGPLAHGLVLGGRVAVAHRNAAGRRPRRSARRGARGRRGEGVARSWSARPVRLHYTGPRSLAPGADAVRPPAVPGADDPGSAERRERPSSGPDPDLVDHAGTCSRADTLGEVPEGDDSPRAVIAPRPASRVTPAIIGPCHEARGRRAAERPPTPGRSAASARASSAGTRATSVTCPGAGRATPTTCWSRRSCSSRRRWTASSRSITSSSAATRRSRRWPRRTSPTSRAPGTPSATTSARCTSTASRARPSPATAAGFPPTTRRSAR